MRWSVVNLLVFVVIMSTFAVPGEHQQRVLTFGILAGSFTSPPAAADPVKQRLKDVMNPGDRPRPTDAVSAA